MLLPILANGLGIPIVVGMNYAMVRQLLIQAGWQPIRHCDVLCDDNYYTKSDEKHNKLAAAFRSRGW